MEHRRQQAQVQRSPNKFINMSFSRLCMTIIINGGIRRLLEMRIQNSRRFSGVFVFPNCVAEIGEAQSSPRSLTLNTLLLSSLAPPCPSWSQQCVSTFGLHQVYCFASPPVHCRLPPCTLVLDGVGVPVDPWGVSREPRFRTLCQPGMGPFSSKRHFNDA